MTQTILYNPYALLFFGTWERGDSSYGYTYGDRDTIYHPYTLSFLETWGCGDSTQGYTYGGTQYTTPIHSHFWRLGDVGTVRTDIHMEIGTQYTTPTHSHFWRLGVVGTVPADIHTEIGTQYTTLIPLYTLIFGDLGTWGQYAKIYIRR